MKKSELIIELSQRVGFDKRVIEQLLKEEANIIIECLQKEESVTIPSLGTLKAERKPPRNGINPKTGKSLHIPERIRVKYKRSKRIHDEVES